MTIQVGGVLRKRGIKSMRLGTKRQVEVYAHGGWWKDSNGQAGQVPPSEWHEPLSDGPSQPIQPTAKLPHLSIQRFGLSQPSMEFLALGAPLFKAGPADLR